MYIAHLDTFFIDAHFYLFWPLLYSGSGLFLVLLHTVNMSLLQDIYILYIFPLWHLHTFG